MYRILILFLFFPLLSKAQLNPGPWHGEFTLNDSVTLPFNFEVKGSSIDIINAQERIHVTEISYKEDTIVIQMPVFDSEIRCRKHGDSLIGNFLNHARTNLNVIPFQAASGKYAPQVNS